MAERAGRLRPACPACGFVHYADPKLATAVIVERAGAVLLGRRVHEPGRGRWSLPAGFVDRGEVVEAAAAREAREELGVEVVIGRLVGLYSQTGDPVVLAVYTATVRAGEPAPGDDLDALGYFSPEALPELAFPHDRQIIADYLSLLPARGTAPLPAPPLP
jgi:ADP-ribose pyrophosphatase YjhB (NUDIX family)